MTPNLIRYLFSIGLFIIPFIFWPAAEVVYEVPRVWFVLRWIELMAAAAILAVLNGVEIGKKDRKIILSVFTFGLIALLASVLGVNWTKSFWGNFYRVDGLFTLFHLVGLFLIIVLFWKENWKRLTVLSIAVSSVLVSVLLLIFQITTFGQPNFLAGYLVVSLPFIGYLAEKSQNKWRYFWVAGFFVINLAIIAAFAKGAILASAIYVLGWLLIHRGWSKKKILGLLLICLIPLVLFFWVQSQGKEFVAESRERIITKGALAFLKRPVLGWGWANFDHAFDSVDWPIRLQHDVYADKAHSSILEVLVTTGILGLSVYLAIIWQLFLRLFKRMDKFTEVLFLALLVFLIHAQTNVISIAEELFFWIILGIVATGVKEVSPTKAG